jgi:Mg2+-importing ATPase
MLVFHAPMEIFRTVWFLESLCTQTFIIFAIRTKRVPFYKSHPSSLLVISSIVVVIIGIGITLLPEGGLFGFVPLTLPYFLFIGALVAVYIVVVEIVKKWFYGHTIDSGGKKTEK